MIEKGLAEVLMRTLPYDLQSYEGLTYYIKTIALGGFMMNGNYDIIIIIIQLLFIFSVPTKKALIKAGVVKDIEAFLSDQHPLTLCGEENTRYYWTFTASFHHLTLSNIPQVQELGAFCLATLSQKGFYSRVSCCVVLCCCVSYYVVTLYCCYSRSVVWCCLVVLY
jgi:hypothetical protein